MNYENTATLNESMPTTPVAVESSYQHSNGPKSAESEIEHLAVCGHEIGHAGMVYWRGESLHGTHVEMNAGGGRFYRRCGTWNITELMVKIAGPLAQCLMLGFTPRKAIRFKDEYANPQSDSFQIREMVRDYCNGKDSRKFQFDVQEQTRLILQHSAMWLALNQATEKVRSAGHIGGDEIQKIFDSHHVPTLFDSPAMIEWVQNSGCWGPLKGVRNK